MVKLGLDTGHSLIQSQLMISHITCVQGLTAHTYAFILVSIHLPCNKDFVGANVTITTE